MQFIGPAFPAVQEAPQRVEPASGILILENVPKARRWFSIDLDADQAGLVSVFYHGHLGKLVNVVHGVTLSKPGCD